MKNTEGGTKAMKIAPKVIDQISEAHERKNLYLRELAALEEKAAAAGGDELKALQEKIAELRRNKSEHPYQKELAAYRAAEKSFLAQLKAEKAREKAGQTEDDPALAKLAREIRQSQKEEAFYAPYVELTYDAELAWRSALVKLRHLPEMMENRRLLNEHIARVQKEKETAAAHGDSAIKAQISAEKKLIEEKYALRNQELKEKQKSGMISPKAVHNESRVLKRAKAEEIQMLEMKDPLCSKTEELRALQHRHKVELKEERAVMQADLSDLYRRIPVETEDRLPLRAWVGSLIPGLSQLLNQQFVKALLFSLSGLFTFLVAIPYALGFGNFRGQGIAGLISLAEGGKRVDRSIIFMIEGIIAIILLLFAAAAYYFHIRDSFHVEKQRLKGIRPNRWTETRQEISRNGFPYIVSAPALIVIVFIVLLPAITTILLSFTNMDPKNQSKFVWIGLENYKTLALGQGVAGKAFWLILGWTVIWTLAATTLAILIGFFLALLVNQERIRGKRFWRTIYLLPWAVPAFITIMFFSIMLAPNGPLTEIISALVGHTVNVKSDTTLTRIALVMLQGWLGSSYIFLLCTGILQSIPSDLYEAADIDGARGFQRIRHITVPLVLFQIAPLLVTQYTFNFNNYSIIALFNDGGPFFPSLYGNLAGSSDILISYIYKLTIDKQYQALGASITVIVSAVLMFISYLGFRKTRAFNS